MQQTDRRQTRIIELDDACPRPRAGHKNHIQPIPSLLSLLLLQFPHLLCMIHSIA